MNDTEMRYYSAALDEIWRLRRLVAMCADDTEADLTYKTYPKSRRLIVEKRVDDLRIAARGESERVLAGQHSNQLNASMERAGTSTTLTRSQWEQEVHNRND